MTDKKLISKWGCALFQLWPTMDKPHITLKRPASLEAHTRDFISLTFAPISPSCWRQAWYCTQVNISTQNSWNHCNPVMAKGLAVNIIKVGYLPPLLCKSCIYLRGNKETVLEQATHVRTSMKQITHAIVLYHTLDCFGFCFSLSVLAAHVTCKLLCMQGCTEIPAKH